ncbi:MAG: hypothetical protein R3B93_15350 [Bacteroidia bacterium]
MHRDSTLKAFTPPFLSTINISELSRKVKAIGSSSSPGWERTVVVNLFSSGGVLEETVFVDDRKYNLP